MDLSYTDEQAMLRDSVDRFGLETWPAAGRRDLLADGALAQRRTWNEMAELGWLLLPIAADRGGLGGSAADVMAVMEAMGRHLIPTPYVASCVLVPGLLAAPGEAADALLEKIGGGAAIAAAALLEAESGYDLHRVDTRAVKTGEGWCIQGAKVHVEDGAEAGWFVVSARTAGAADDLSGIGLFLVEADAPGVTVERFRAIDSHRHCRLRLNGASAVPLGDVESALPVIEAAVDRAIAAHAAEATGSMDAAAAVTLDYLKTRKQFGVAIGSFQALQHRMVDMTVACEEARSLTYNATLRLEDGVAERRRAIAAAKVGVGINGLFVGQQAVQLHGGVGFSDELIVSHHLRRQMMLNIAYGSVDHHRARFAATPGTTA